MIVDKEGKIFEDRRKQKSDRRKNEFDAKGGRREDKDRRKIEQVQGKKK